MKEPNFDLRACDAKTLTEVRKRGVLMVQRGESPERVAEVLGVSRAAVYNWLSLYRQGGWQNLDAKKRGGRRRKLGTAAIRWVYQTVTTKDPRQLKFGFALWTVPAIGEAVRQRWSVDLSRWSVMRLLRQLGLTPQRPLWRAWQQDPEAVKRWLEVEYPALIKRAKKEGAEIWFGDEAGVRSDEHSGRTWAPRGRTPVVKVTGERFGLNIVSAVSPRGELRFMVVGGTVNAGVFVEFLRRMAAQSSRKVILVVDGHPTHKARKTRAFAAANADKIELVYLPAYSPELNPDELVWNDLKNNFLRKLAIGSKAEMYHAVSSYLHALQKMGDHVRSFFRHPETAYAAIW
jgi:transposase